VQRWARERCPEPVTVRCARGWVPTAVGAGLLAKAGSRLAALRDGSAALTDADSCAAQAVNGPRRPPARPSAAATAPAGPGPAAPSRQAGVRATGACPLGRPARQRHRHDLVGAAAGRGCASASPPAVATGGDAPHGRLRATRLLSYRSSRKFTTPSTVEADPTACGSMARPRSAQPRSLLSALLQVDLRTTRLNGGELPRGAGSKRRFHPY
jgi:hypothetical protein